MKKLERGCEDLESIHISSTVSDIYVGIVYGCVNLTSITIDEKNIKFDSREDCSTLEKIELPESVIYLAEKAFKNCTGLTSIVIPKRVTLIKSEAFFGCDNLENVYYMGNEEDWNKIKIHGDNEKLLSAKITYNYKGE